MAPLRPYLIKTWLAWSGLIAGIVIGRRVAEPFWAWWDVLPPYVEGIVFATVIGTLLTISSSVIWWAFDNPTYSDCP